MKKILLACCSGVSTSMLVNNMKKAAEDQGLDVEIWAVGQNDVEKSMENADVLLCGPQMRFLETKLAPKGEELGIPVDVIDTKTYGRCDGQAVLKTALDLIAAK